MLLCFENELQPSSYTSGLVGSALEKQETPENHHSMAAGNRRRKVGPRGGSGGVAAPRVRPHPSRPALRPPSRGWFLGGPGPLPRGCSAQILCWSGPLLGTLVQNLHYAFSFAHFDHFPLVFKYLSGKTCFLQYKWNFVNSKGIRVKRLFISPILDNNWWSNVVVSDRQQIPQA